MIVFQTALLSCEDIQRLFRDYQNYSLTGIYDDGQKYAENLYITNEDTPRLKEYLRQKQSKGKSYG